MKIHIPVVIFFTVGMVPTADELKRGLAARARFRNGALNDGKVEECDYVMGAVPEQYAHVPVYAEDPEPNTPDEQVGEQVGAFFLRQVERGKWNVFDEDGAQFNEDPLSKADARALALKNTEES